MPIVVFIFLIFGVLNFTQFNCLVLIVFILITLAFYRVCYYLKLKKIQACFSYLHGGLVVGLNLRLIIYFWISKNYPLFILLPIIAVIQIIIYEELFKKNYSLNPTVNFENDDSEKIEIEQQVEAYFSDPKRLIGISINEIEKQYNAGVCSDLGSFDFGISYYIWYTERFKIEIFTKNEICTDISLTERITEKSELQK